MGKIKQFGKDFRNFFKKNYRNWDNQIASFLGDREKFSEKEKRDFIEKFQLDKIFEIGYPSEDEYASDKEWLEQWKHDLTFIIKPGIVIYDMDLKWYVLQMDSEDGSLICPEPSKWFGYVDISEFLTNLGNENLN